MTKTLGDLVGEAELKVMHAKAILGLALSGLDGEVKHSPWLGTVHTALHAVNDLLVQTASLLEHDFTPHLYKDGKAPPTSDDVEALEGGAA